MVRKLMLVGIIAVLVLAVAAPALATRKGEGGRGDGVTVFVEKQGLYYDSIITAYLPNKGPFQELIVDEDTGALSTEFGPGDPGYLGGRWWVDANGNDEMDQGDAFFLCPLLGPGYES